MKESARFVHKCARLRPTPVVHAAALAELI
jgi:hypothetical protein